MTELIEEHPRLHTTHRQAFSKMAQTSAKALQTSLNKLQISTDTKPTASKTSPAESWEDEDTPSSSDTETADTPPTSAITLSSSYDIPAPPPPTPASPSTTLPWTSNTLSNTTPNSQYHSTPPYGFDGTNDDVPTSSSSSKRGTSNADDKRPEKSTAVASRLIAAGIGQKAPKRTREQREYDQALKVQEKKKRDAIKEEEERKKRDLELARRAIWED